MMCCARSGLIGTVLCLMVAMDAQGSERILSFHSDITVKPDSTLEVRETLQVQAEGDRIDAASTATFRLNTPTRMAGGEWSVSI